MKEKSVSPLNATSVIGHDKTGIARGPFGEALEISANFARRPSAFVDVAVLSTILGGLVLTGSVSILHAHAKALQFQSVPALVGISVLATSLHASKERAYLLACLSKLSFDPRPPEEYEPKSSGV